MAQAKIIIEVEHGPALRTALDALECAIDVAELIPDWHEQERTELVSRCQALRDIICDRMHSKCV
jgi:hypothetical protein